MRCLYLMSLMAGNRAVTVSLTEAGLKEKGFMMRLVIILIVLLLISFPAY